MTELIYWNEFSRFHVRDFKGTNSTTNSLPFRNQMKMSQSRSVEEEEEEGEDLNRYVRGRLWLGRKSSCDAAWWRPSIFSQTFCVCTRATMHPSCLLLNRNYRLFTQQMLISSQDFLSFVNICHAFDFQWFLFFFFNWKFRFSDLNTWIIHDIESLESIIRFLIINIYHFNSII